MKMRTFAASIVATVALSVFAIAARPSPAAQPQTAAVPGVIVSAPRSTVVEPDITWQRTYGDDDLFAGDVIEQRDGNFAATGEFIYYDAENHEGGAIYLLHAGANFGLKLSQTFEDHGIGNFYTGAFIHQTDNGFVVAGSKSDAVDAPYTYCYLVEYNAQGDKLWSNSYKPVHGNATCNGATATPDGGYVLVGSVRQLLTNEHVYVVKTDAQGNVEWSNVIPDPAGLGDVAGIARSVTVAPGGYAVTGNVFDESTRIQSAFLVRLNPVGKMIGNESYNYLLPGTSKTDLDGMSVQRTKNGYVIAGSAIGYIGTQIGIHPRAAFLLNLSANGKVRWARTYGLLESAAAASVSNTNDGGFVLTGTTNCSTEGIQDALSICGRNASSHAYIVRTDSDGTELWDKTIDDYPSGGKKIVVTSDGGYIMVGMGVPGIAADTLLVRIAPDIKPSDKKH